MIKEALIVVEGYLMAQCLQNSPSWLEIKQTLIKGEMYYQALCDIESGKDVRKILERTLT